MSSKYFQVSLSDFFFPHDYLAAFFLVCRYLGLSRGLSDCISNLIPLLLENILWIICLVQCCSVTQSFPTLCDPMDCSTPGFPVHHQLLELTQTHVIKSVMPSNHLILCRPLLLPPSIFPSIRVFSNESVLHIGWPKVDDLSPFKFVETCLILHTTRAIFLNLALSACGENKVISLVSLLMRLLIPFMEASRS